MVGSAGGVAGQYQIAGWERVSFGENEAGRGYLLSRLNSSDYQVSRLALQSNMDTIPC